MPDNRGTLLAKLAPMFGAQTENVAVEALGHILSGSEAARRALSDVVRAGGAEVGQILQVRTQATDEVGARPDLAGLDGRGDERARNFRGGCLDCSAWWMTPPIVPSELVGPT